MRPTIILAAAAALALPGAAHAERIFGLTLDNRIVTFDSSAPTNILASRRITGLAPGEELVGFDLRPANGRLYALSRGGTLYELNQVGNTFAATMTGMLTASPMGTAFGFDFNPVPDRLRVVSDTGQNLRINVDGGATIVDGAVTSTTGPVMLVGAAYTNNRPGVTSSTLYAIDAMSNSLLRSTDPNAGTYTNTNMMGMAFQPLGFTFTNQNAVGFDVSGRSGRAFANLDSLFWEIDLMTGQATTLGVVGAGPLQSITAAGAIPEPATWAMLVAGFGIVGAGLRRRRRPALALS